MALFSKDPRLPRFELRMVDVLRRKDFDPQLKASGFIEVAACLESLGCPKPESGFYESLETFLNIRRLYPKNCYCFASNSVQIHVKLDFTTREVDSILRLRSLYAHSNYNVMVKDDVYQNEVERDDDDDDNLGFRLFKDDVEKDDDLERYYDNDKIYELPSLYDDVSGDDEDEVVLKKEKVENDTFEVSNSIDLSETAKKPYGGYGSHILIDKCGFLELYYVALMYTVDATLEVELLTCKEEKVVATVYAKYGEFDYGMDEGPYCERILQPDIFVKPGKLNLMQSVFAVPARYCLRIHASLCLTSGTEILDGIHEFHMPLNGNSSFAYIEGSDCGLKLKMDWKLPHNMPRSHYR